MFITFTQAMSNTTMTAPSIAQTIWRSCTPVNALISGSHTGRGEILIRLRIVGRDVARDRDHLRVRLVERDARLQSAHDRRRAIVRTEEQAHRAVSAATHCRAASKVPPKSGT